MLTCKKCGHQWHNKIANPIRCPKCSSTNYNEAPVYEVRRIRAVAKEEPETKTETFKKDIKKDNNPTVDWY